MTTDNLLAIDQGTTSSRAILFSKSGDIISLKQRELKLHYPQKGWVEQSAEDIWNDTLWAAKEVLKTGEASAIGITNQRETTVIWNKKTGKPIYNAIVWQDRRTIDYCKQIQERGHTATISQKTGLLIDSYFSATKIRWLLENIDGAQAAAEKGELAFGTMDCWLLWNLTGGKVHATDITNASRTLLFNIQTNKWDDELLSIFDIPKSILPEVKENVSDFGTVSASLIGQELSVLGMAGDQQSAVIGQACFEPGMTKSTYGTGCFALMNIGEEFRTSQNKLLTTIAYTINGKTAYAIEGSIFVAGAAIQWLRDNLEFFETSDESEKLALSVPDSNGVYFVPAFAGLGAPYWHPEVRGAIFGLTRESNKAHITRAALEAQAYQTKGLMSAMCKDGNCDIKNMRIDGGLTRNDFFCQFLADMINLSVEVPKTYETTAWGAACLAGIGAGIFKGTEDIAKVWQQSKKFEPQLSSDERQKLYEGWTDCVDKLIA